MLPEEKFNSRPGAVQNAKFELQKVPGQDLVQKGLFPLLTEDNFISRPGAFQSAKFELPNAPGQNLDQKGRFPMISKGNRGRPSVNPKLVVGSVFLFDFNLRPALGRAICKPGQG